MRALVIAILLFIPFFNCATAAPENSTPYVEIKVQGLEQLAPPLNRLADAVEELSRSDKLSNEDQQKIVAIIGELKLLGERLDTSIEQGKQKFSKAQQEVSDSIRQQIILALLGLVVCVILICAAIFLLFRLQIAPLLTTTSTSLETFAGAMERLSAGAEIIAAHERSNDRRFARSRPR